MSALSTSVGTNTMLELLPKALSAIVSLSALGYFVGWKEAETYYTAIGAGWVAALVPPQALLQQSASTILAIVFGAFYSIVLLDDKKINERKLSWACAIFIFLSGICLFTSQSTFLKLPTSAAYSLAFVGSVLCAVAGGITFAELYGHARINSTQFSSRHLWLVYWMVLPGLFWAPERLGQAQSMRDMDVKQSPLPTVKTGSTPTTETWRLVQLLQDKALLVKLDQKPADRLFKVVDIKDIQSIQATSPLVKN